MRTSNSHGLRVEEQHDGYAAKDASAVEVVAILVLDASNGWSRFPHQVCHGSEKQDLGFSRYRTFT